MAGSEGTRARCRGQDACTVHARTTTLREAAIRISPIGFALFRPAPALPSVGPSHREPPLTPRLTVITLGVDDLPRALRFYREGLGLPTPGIIGTEFEHGAVVFIELQAGLKLALWPRASLSHDSGLPCPSGTPATCTLGHNVGSAEEVDAVLQEARQAGATIVKPGRPTSWGGYSGYFSDPDGHLWEVVFNPQAVPGI